MPVEEDIDLNTISEEELEKLVGQAEKMEAAAEKAEKAKHKLQNLVAGVDPLGSPLASGAVGGIFGGAVVGRGKTIPITAESGLLSGAGAPLARGREKVVTERKLFDILNKKESEILNKISMGIGGVRDPMGFLQSGALGALARFALPVGAVLTIATMIFEMIKKQFGPGGIWDIRKMVLDETSEFMDQHDLIDIDRGTIYFATTKGIHQEAPDFANTERLVDGHLKDILRNEGQ